MLARLQRLRELERGLPPNCTIHAVQRAAGALVAMISSVSSASAARIEPVRGVVVGRDRFRIAVDHDGLVADLAQREARGSAIVELDALAMRFGPPPRITTFSVGRRASSHRNVFDLRRAFTGAPGRRGRAVDRKKS